MVRILGFHCCGWSSIRGLGQEAWPKKKSWARMGVEYFKEDRIENWKLTSSLLQ